MGELIRETNEGLDFGNADLSQIAKKLGLDSEMPADESFALTNLIETCQTYVSASDAEKAGALKALALMLNENDLDKVKKFAWEVGSLDKSH